MVEELASLGVEVAETGKDKEGGAGAKRKLNYDELLALIAEQNAQIVLLAEQNAQIDC